MSIKKRYRVVGDSKNTFMDVEMDVVVDDELTIGSDFVLLGGNFKLTQTGAILVLVDKEWCLSIMDITPKEVKEIPKLLINDTLEIYLETKEIEVRTKCTYEELYYVLADEWKMLRTMLNQGDLPFDYTERFKLFTFKENWNFTKGSLAMMSGGSYTRLNNLGRSI